MENAKQAFETDLPESVKQQLHDPVHSRVMNIWSGYTTTYAHYRDMQAHKLRTSTPVVHIPTSQDTGT